jgi:hypothetical protein
MHHTNGTAVLPFNPLIFHQYAIEYTMDDTVNLASYLAGTEFHLEVKAFDNHYSTEKVTKSIHFK